MPNPAVLNVIIMLYCLSSITLAVLFSNIRVSLSTLPVSWSSGILTTFSKMMIYFSIEFHLACFHPKFCNLNFFPFISTLVPDWHFRVFHLASLSWLFISGFSLSPLCTHVLSSQLCDAFYLTHDFRASILYRNRERTTFCDAPS